METQEAGQTVASLISSRHSTLFTAFLRMLEASRSEDRGEGNQLWPKIADAFDEYKLWAKNNMAQHSVQELPPHKVQV